MTLALLRRVYCSVPKYMSTLYSMHIPTRRILSTVKINIESGPRALDEGIATVTAHPPSLVFCIPILVLAICSLLSLADLVVLEFKTYAFT